MTKRQREQVVELLRCAADIAIRGDRSSALGVAVFRLDDYFAGGMHWSGLLHGRGPVQNDERNGHFICGPGYEFCLLEAAARVEEGSWP